MPLRLVAATVALGAGPVLVGAQSPRSVEEADVIRDTLTLQSTARGVTLGDVVALPLDVIALPLRLTFIGTAELAGFVASPERYGPAVDAYRALERRGIVPALTTDTGRRSGLALSVAWTFAAPVVLETELSTRAYQRYRLAWSATAGTEAWRLGVETGFRRLTQEPFWGLGIDASDVDRTDYLEDIWSAGVTVLRRFGPHRTISIGTGWERRTVGRGRDTATPDLVDNFTARDLPGLGDPTNFLSTSITLAADEVEHRRDAQPRGGRASVGGRWRIGIGGDEIGFGAVDAEARGFLPVSSHQYVSARATVSSLVGAADRAPFTLLPALGGSSLRSYESGRFREAAVVSASLGWHWELWRDLRERARIEAYLFLDHGSVGRALSSLSSPRSSWGFGMGGRWLDEFSASVYVASGAEGTRWSGEISAEAF